MNKYRSATVQNVVRYFLGHLAWTSRTKSTNDSASYISRLSKKRKGEGKQLQGIYCRASTSNTLPRKLGLHLVKNLSWEMLPSRSTSVDIHDATCLTLFQHSSFKTSPEIFVLWYLKLLLRYITLKAYDFKPHKLSAYGRLHRNLNISSISVHTALRSFQVRFIASSFLALFCSF